MKERSVKVSRLAGVLLALAVLVLAILWFSGAFETGKIPPGEEERPVGLVPPEMQGQAVREGKPVREAILDCGAVRMRPILLTAASAALGAWPITLDPIFSGLAWALIFGLFASTAFTLILVPVMYYVIYGRRLEAAESESGGVGGRG